MPLPTAAAARKAVPIFSGVIRYFPNALCAVADLSRIGNEQHNPGKDLFWDRSKSGDELDALMRHLVDAGTVDTDGVLHSTKIAWRALANLEKELERARGESEELTPEQREALRKFGVEDVEYPRDGDRVCADCGNIYGHHHGSGMGIVCPSYRARREA